MALCCAVGLDVSLKRKLLSSHLFVSQLTNLSNSFPVEVNSRKKLSDFVSLFFLSFEVLKKVTKNILSMQSWMEVTTLSHKLDLSE